MQDKIFFSGSSNITLAKKIVQKVGTRLTAMDIEFFPNGESRIWIKEDIEGRDVYIVQPTNDPTNKYIVELALIADAAKRKGARSVTAVMPWFGYAPQDKVFREGEPLSSQVVIRMLESSGIDEFVTVDIHSPLILEFFETKVTNLTILDTFANYIKDMFEINKEEWSVVALDKGGYKRAVDFAEKLKLDLAAFHKTRDRHTGKVTFNNLEGDVRGKKLIAFDDFTSTGSTLMLSAQHLKAMGAEEYFCCVTHVVVHDTLEKIQRSEIDSLMITNSINFPTMAEYSKVHVVDISDLIVDWIRHN